MLMIDKKIEILAPAGSYNSLRAAVSAGADAVYLGGTRFGARAFAQNFNEEEMLSAIDYAHIHGRRVYLTVNTLLKNAELDELYGYLYPFYREGLDGVIVQDLGAAERIREWYPRMELHASTQMTITHTAGAELLKERGFVRVVPARELSLSEIRSMKRQTGLEMECFVHGALCYCYSGQCLLSSMIGGRSGNRGQCAQPCRLPYSVSGKQPADLMSLKDLCTIDLLPQLIEAGVDSFKIEGRMKQPEYVYTVTEVYRRYADRYLSGEGSFHVDEEDRNKLLSVYRRRGYTDGYYHRHNGKEMISFGRMDGGEEPPRETVYKTQEKILGKLTLSPGEPAKLVMECGKVRCECEGGVPEPAKRQPLTAGRIREQMEKTGNTEYVFEQLEVEVEGELFLPMQALNELRRRGIWQLTEEILNSYRREIAKNRPQVCPPVKETEEPPRRLRLAALVQDTALLPCLGNDQKISRIYVESEIAFTKNMIKYMKKEEKKQEYFLAMPYIFREQTQRQYEEYYPLLEQMFDGVLVRNLESICWLREHGYQKPVRTDSNVYCFNRYSKAVIRELGMEGFTAPVELNRGELKDLGLHTASLVVYGHQPVMVSANCIRKTTNGCSCRNGWMWVKDRYQKKFAVKNCCDYCYNVVYNTSFLYLADLAEEICGLKPQEIRMDFTTETPEEAGKIAGLYRDAFLLGMPTRIPENGFTRGHYKRGVK